MIADVLQWIYNTTFATSVRQDEFLFATVESIHVVAFTTVVGSISFVDMRLIGLASRNRPVSAVIKEVLPLTWAVFALAVFSGTTLFCSNGTVYYENVAFRLKMLLILLAGINMAFFHLVTYRNIKSWDLMPRPPRPAQIAGALSIALWFGSIVWGRLIGFTVR